MNKGEMHSVMLGPDRYKRRLKLVFETRGSRVNH